jgi:hypothetical protein
LHGALHLPLFSRGDIAADDLRRALHGFSGNFQTSQHLHLFAAMIEGRLLPDQSLHAPHAG